MFTARRITEYDVVVTAEAGRGESLALFVAALRKAGFRAWKLMNRAQFAPSYIPGSPDDPSFQFTSR